MTAETWQPGTWVYEWDSYKKEAAFLGRTDFTWQPVGVTIGWYPDTWAFGCWHEAVT